MSASKLKRKIDAWIRSWSRKGYPGGIPDEAPILLEEAGRVPSYRMICKAIMKNDVCLLTLGGNRPKCEIYTALKKAELRAKGKRVWEARQTKMF